MPDWFYRTLSRPALFLLPPKHSRDIALGFMGGLAALPFGAGGKIIDFLGHMRPDPRLKVSALGLQFSSPVGLGPRLDPEGHGVRALARFGVGFIEVGPVKTSVDTAASISLLRNVADEALWIPEPGESFGPTAIASRLKGIKREKPVLILRLAPSATASPQIAAGELATLAKSLNGVADLFSLEVPQATGWTKPD